MKVSLKAPFFYNGHRYSGGDVVDLPAGMDGPYIDGRPAYDVIDEEAWNERQELRAKHAKEMEELETPERKRAALIKKQAEESVELRRKHAAKELALRHEREQADLDAQHNAQTEALKNRKPEHVAAPRETNEAQLGERHRVESEDLAKRQEAEKTALAEEHEEADARKVAADEPSPTKARADEPKADRKVSRGLPPNSYTD